MKRSDKKAMSVMIAYIILISIALAMSPLVYKYLKTYIEGEEVPECPSDVSLFIKKLNRTYINDETHLNITLKNTGLFNLGGFIIKTAENTDSFAANDLSDYAMGKTSLNPGIKFGSLKSENFNLNTLSPGDEETNLFIVSPKINITLVEITPFIWIEEKGKTRFAICDNSKTSETISPGTTGFGN